MNRFFGEWSFGELYFGEPPFGESGGYIITLHKYMLQLMCHKLNKKRVKIRTIEFQFEFICILNTCTFDTKFPIKYNKVKTFRNEVEKFHRI